MGVDLRSSRRVAVTFPVRLSSDSMVGQGTVINLSVPGCAIQARPLTVTLAKVRWASLQTAGIEFIRVRRDDQGRIQHLIGQLLDEAAVEAGADQRELTVA